MVPKRLQENEMLRETLSMKDNEFQMELANVKETEGSRDLLLEQVAMVCISECLIYQMKDVQ